MNNKGVDIKQSGWNTADKNQVRKIFEFCKEYADFLNICKTERETIDYIKDKLINNGFISINEVNNVKAGDKVFLINRNKSLYAAIIGNDNIENGLNIIGSHVDAPRIDLKPNAIFEESLYALFETHYYGGIKKYQWTTIPLELHGIVITKDGKKIDVCIGEDSSDPVFCITDLLPHLSNKQNNKILANAIEGEDLNAIIGNVPFNNSVKENVLKILNNKYKIEENDFLSSELELVPSFNAKDVGFDQSMVGGYGQDDRVCVFTSLKGLLEIKNPQKTAICIFADKEEVGSMGNTGMMSNCFDEFIRKIIEFKGINDINKVFCNSKMLSADVGAAFDPNYKEAFEKNNSSFLGCGIEISKYTGSNGKSGASDANAEYIAYIRRLLENNNLKYQVSELGKVDLGGGGTIAYILANKGIDVIDCGVTVLSMHSPFEITSKFDIYTAYEFYKLFYEN
ncbi:MAG: aminopeptidase [Bacilli bacterium]